MHIPWVNLLVKNQAGIALHLWVAKPEQDKTTNKLFFPSFPSHIFVSVHETETAIRSGKVRKILKP